MFTRPLSSPINQHSLRKISQSEDLMENRTADDHKVHGAVEQALFSKPDSLSVFNEATDELLIKRNVLTVVIKCFDW